MQIQPDQVTASLNGIVFGGVDQFGVDWTIDEGGIDGWSATKPTTRAQPRSRRSGSLLGSSFASGRTVSWSGMIFAPTADLLRDAIDRLNAAVTLSDSQLFVTEASLTRYAWMRQGDDVITKHLMPTIATYSVQLTGKDWRKFGTDVSDRTRLPSTSGGLVIPPTVSNPNPGTNVKIRAAGGNAADESVVPNMTLSGLVPGASTGVQLSLSISMALNSYVKSAIARLRDGVGGPVLASYVFSDKGDSTSGNAETWATALTVKPASGTLVVTIASNNANTPEIWSANRSDSAAGLTIPAAGLTINAVTVTGQVSLTNPGNDTGPLRLRIDGPCTGPVVTHVGTGDRLVFSSSLVLAAGEWLDIDMEKHQVYANGQSSRAGYITARGWFGFDPGPNTFAFTAAQYDAASQLTVAGTPAWR